MKHLEGCYSVDLAVEVLVELLHDLLEAEQIVLHVVLCHDQAQVELGERCLQKFVIHLPAKNNDPIKKGPISEVQIQKSSNEGNNLKVPIKKTHEN